MNITGGRLEHFLLFSWQCKTIHESLSTPEINREPSFVKRFVTKNSVVPTFSFFFWEIPCPYNTKIKGMRVLLTLYTPYVVRDRAQTWDNGKWKCDSVAIKVLRWKGLEVCHTLKWFCFVTRIVKMMKYVGVTGLITKT